MPAQIEVRIVRPPRSGEREQGLGNALAKPVITRDIRSMRAATAGREAGRRAGGCGTGRYRQLGEKSF